MPLLGRLLLLLLLALPGSAWARGDASSPAEPSLAAFLPGVPPAEMVPGADRFGPPEGTPPVVPAYAGHRLLGWVYLNTDFTSATGYSGWPIHILVGLSTAWRITGARLVEHHEPMLLSGVGADRIAAVTDSYVGLDVAGITSVAAARSRETISGASVSATVMGDSILRSAVLLMRQRRPELEAALPAEAPAWVAVWRAHPLRLAVLGAALLSLAAVLACHRRLARHPVALDRFRLAFLAFTLLWIGFYAQAQLSVVTLLAVVASVRGVFGWSALLMAPAVCLLWAATLLSLPLWGRGAFCGWLCPYGAAQELAARAARALGVRPWRVPWRVQRGLGWLKYAALAGLVGLAVHALAPAERAAEIEPFRTVFSLGFARPWPFGLYALAWLGLGLFVARPFCRFLCPLGAALALPAWLGQLVHLPRRPGCGHPCRRCAQECPVQAIAPGGTIAASECIACLHCEGLYDSDTGCPLRRREARHAR